METLNRFLEAQEYSLMKFGSTNKLGDGMRLVQMVRLTVKRLERLENDYCNNCQKTASAFCECIDVGFDALDRIEALAAESLK